MNTMWLFIAHGVSWIYDRTMCFLFAMCNAFVQFTCVWNVLNNACITPKNAAAMITACMSLALTANQQRAWSPSPSAHFTNSNQLHSLETFSNLLDNIVTDDLTLHLLSWLICGRCKVVLCILPNDKLFIWKKNKKWPDQRQTQTHTPTCMTYSRAGVYT